MQYTNMYLQGIRSILRYNSKREMTVNTLRVDISIWGTNLVLTLLRGDP
jgi:hypothetical protein